MSLRARYTTANLLPWFCGLPDSKRGRRLVLASKWTWFFDDSGSEPSRPIFVLAGFLSDADAWVAFSNEWQAILDRPPKLEYFKMTEAAHLGGQFSRRLGWDEQKRDERLVDLVGVIQRHAKARYSTALSHAHFRTMRALPANGRNVGTDHPFSLQAGKAIVGARLYASDLGIRNVDIVFDSQDGIAEHFLANWGPFREYLKDHPIGNAFDIGAAPSFQDEKEFLPLQAADLFAWHVRRHMEREEKARPLIVPESSLLRAMTRIRGRHEPVSDAVVQGANNHIVSLGIAMMKAGVPVQNVKFSPDKREQRRARRSAKRKKKH